MYKKLSILGLAVSLIMFIQVKAYADNNLSHIGTGFFGYHSSFVQNDGSLFMWGSNEDGQLGINNNLDEGGTEFEINPRIILKNVKFASLGNNSSALIKKDSTLWMAGNNEYGQLGDNTRKSRSSFTKVKNMDNVAYVSLGQNYTLAVKNDGSLWAWGDNYYGQFCNGGTKNSLTPTKVMDNVKVAYAGYSHTAIIKTDGSLWMCGYNGDGNLGIGYTSSKEIKGREVPFFDEFGVEVPVKDVSLGYGTTLFLLKDGTLLFAGHNWVGDACLGDESIDKKISTPVSIAKNVKIARKSITFTAYVTKDNILYMCGDNSYGQLGFRYLTVYSIAQKVMNNVRDIQMGQSYSIALSYDGNLYGWGSNSLGQLGLGNISEVVSSPKKVNLPTKFSKIPSGLKLKYNGNNQVGVESGEGYSILDNTGKDVGNYKATLRLLEGYIWADGTTEDKEINWEIVRAYVVSIPKGQTLLYNGKTQTGVVRGDGYTISGNTASQVGNYKATLKLTSDGYGWTDGTTKNKEIEWSILRAYIVKIPVGLALEYNGFTQTGVECGEGYNITGNVGKNAGNYKATLKLSSNGYGWVDGTTNNKEIKWSISKVKNPLTVVGKNIKIKLKSLSRGGAIILSRNFLEISNAKGKLTYSKRHGSAKIKVENNTGNIRISKGLRKGKYVIKINVAASGDQNFTSELQTVKVRITVR